MRVSLKPVAGFIKRGAARAWDEMAVRVMPADRYVGYDPGFRPYSDTVQLHRGIDPQTGRRYNRATLRVLSGHNQLTRDVTDLVGLTGFLRQRPRVDTDTLSIAVDNAIATGQQVDRALTGDTLRQLGEAGLDAAYMTGGSRAVEAAALEKVGRAGLTEAYLNGGWSGVRQALQKRFGFA